MSVYFDCNATTPVEPSILKTVFRFMEQDYGNAASPIHDYGTYAKTSADFARRQVAAVVKARPDEVIFTSGATESNNIAILGTARAALKKGLRHVITTGIEHKSVLETVEALKKMGCETDVVQAGVDGRFRPEHIASLLREDTFLVSVMHANNETGILQPVLETADLLKESSAYLHVDAAQGFGKEFAELQSDRVDMISVSGHKIYAPKGIGALILRKRDGEFPLIEPLMYGGGQEQGLRAGTLPVQLIAGLGEASKLALCCHEERAETCRKYRGKVLKALEGTKAVQNGDENFTLPHVINFSLPGVDPEKAIDALKDVVSISSVSACTAHVKEPSHVLEAMGLPPERTGSSLRFSWCHMTPDADWSEVNRILKELGESA